MKDIFLGEFNFEKKRLDISAFKSQINNPYVFNNFICFIEGEIINEKKLCKEYNFPLNSKNHEIVIRLFLCLGSESFNLFEGEWIIFLYNKIDNSLFFIRNHTDVYSYYYQISSTVFRFSNSINKLTEGENVKQDRDAVNLFLEKGSIGVNTFFRGIKKLPLGAFLHIKNKIPYVKRFWYPENNSDLVYRNKRDYTLHLQEILKKNIISDLQNEPSVVALSSGLDSPMIFNEIRRNTNNKIIVVSQKPKEWGQMISHVANEYPLVKDWLHNKTNTELIPIHGIYTFTQANDIIHQVHGEPIWGSANVSYVLDYYRITQKKNINYFFTGYGGNYTTSWSSAELYNKFRNGDKRFIFFNQYVYYHNLNQIIRRKKRDRLAISSIKDWKRQMLKIGLGDIGFYGNISRHYDINILAPLISKEIVEFCLSVPENIFFDKTGNSRQLALDYYKRFSDFRYVGKRGMQVSDIHRRFEEEKNIIMKDIELIKNVNILKQMINSEKLFLNKENIWGDLRKYYLLRFLFRKFYL